MIYYRRHVVVMMMSIMIASLFQHQHIIYIQPVSSLVFEFTGDEKEMGFSLEDWEIHEFGDHEDDGNGHGDDDDDDDKEVWNDDDEEVWNDDDEKVWNDDDDEVWNDDETHNSEKCRSISGMICSNDDFTILCTVMKQIGYDSIFDDDDDDSSSSTVWTLFAPTNEAFNNLSMDMTNDILSSNENTEYVLLYHTVDDIELSSEDLECTELVPMANGKDTRTACLNGNKVYQKGSGNNDDDALPEIVEVDIPACNGIIHVINQVILPKKLPDNNVHHEDDHEDDHHDDEDEDHHEDDDEDHHDNDEPAYKPTQKPNDDHDDFFSPTTPEINYPHEKPDHDYYPDNKSLHPTRKPTNKPTKPPIATLYPTPYPTPYPTTSKPTNKPTKKPPSTKSTTVSLGLSAST